LFNIVPSFNCHIVDIVATMIIIRVIQSQLEFSVLPSQL